MSQAAVPVYQTSVVHAGEVGFCFADFERNAICFVYDCFVIATDEAPRRGNSDARWTPDTAVG
jgi:hypothetical protein